MKGENENGRERGRGSEEVRMMMIVLSPELFDYCLMLDDKPWIVLIFNVLDFLFFGNKTT